MELEKRVAANERRHTRNSRRVYALALFVLVAFLVLAWRTEQSDHRITETQEASCARGVMIIARFNHLQDELYHIEAKNMSVTSEIREARIRAYQAARILPLPTCPPKMVP